MDSEGISQAQAAAALATIEDCRELIRAERAKQRGTRFWHLLLGGITPLVVYTSKDLVPSRAKRWALIAGWQAVLAALTALTRSDSRVLSGLPMARPDAMKRNGVMTFAAIFGMAGAERLTVWALRRSRLRRPNLVAGFAVAAIRIGVRGFLLDRITRAWRHTEPVTSAELHPALRRPETFRLAALLGGGEMVELSFLRETFGVDRLGLAAILQPLVDDKLLKSVVMRDSVRVYLNPDGRDAFARHELALRELSTGDTPR
jgi:hypothetical protein